MCQLGSEKAIYGGSLKICIFCGKSHKEKPKRAAMQKRLFAYIFLTHVTQILGTYRLILFIFSHMLSLSTLTSKIGVFYLVAIGNAKNLS